MRGTRGRSATRGRERGRGTGGRHAPRERGPSTRRISPKDALLAKLIAAEKLFFEELRQLPSSSPKGSPPKGRRASTTGHTDGRGTGARHGQVSGAQRRAFFSTDNTAASDSGMVLLALGSGVGQSGGGKADRASLRAERIEHMQRERRAADAYMQTERRAADARIRAQREAAAGKRCVAIWRKTIIIFVILRRENISTRYVPKTMYLGSLDISQNQIEFPNPAYIPLIFRLYSR